MKPKGQIFDACAVRGFLDGKKTQHRVPVKARGWSPSDYAHVKLLERDKRGGELHAFFSADGGDDSEWLGVLCPWKVGDVLFAKETWAPDAPSDGTWPDTVFYGCKDAPLSLIPERYRSPGHCIFRATHDLPIKWRSSTTMPAWAARIWLEVESVRVERVQEITDDDAMAEGVTRVRDACHVVRGHGYDLSGLCHTSAITPYHALWIDRHGEESWERKDWIWVPTYRVLSVSGKPDEMKGAAE